MSAVLEPGGKPLDTLKTEAEIRRLIAESDKLQAETGKLLAEQIKFGAEQAKFGAEQAKFGADQAKLYAEASKLTREKILFPIIAFATAAGAVIGIGTLVLKAFGH